MIRRIGQRLTREEHGQVLYMALVLLMVLVLFSYVLVNVAYVAGMKIKAQNLADNMALSGATLKARLLNQMESINAILFFVVRKSGFVSELLPYTNPAEMMSAAFVGYLAYGASFTVLGEYHATVSQKITTILEKNRVDPALTKVKLYPVLKIDPWLDLDYVEKMIMYLNPPAEPAPALFRITEIKPRYAWYVQSRVEWNLKEALVGGKTLGIELPDLVTRSRAEIISEYAPAWGKKWRIRLASPRDDVDEFIRTHGTD